MKIAVLSDTHWQPGSPLPGVLAQIAAQKPDLILHAGDWTHSLLFRELQKLAPVEMVLGNCDRDTEGFHVNGQKPEYYRVVEAGGLRIGLTHGHLYDYLPTPQSAQKTFAALGEEVQAVVFGHSHIPLCERQGDVLMFNPGSASRPLGEIKKPSYGLLTIEEGEIKGEIIYFEK